MCVCVEYDKGRQGGELVRGDKDRGCHSHGLYSHRCYCGQPTAKAAQKYSQRSGPSVEQTHIIGLQSATNQKRLQQYSVGGATHATKQ